MFRPTLIIGLWGAATAAAMGQEFEITRSTIDGGGVMRSAGGEFEASGTIGQADAGVLTGEGYELFGGFWFPLVAGDCDDHGGVGLFDVAGFVACQTGPITAPLPGECRCYDVNRTGATDLVDYAEIQGLFSGA